MLTLGIDTSNYATSLAVFDTAAGEVVCDKKKFLPVRPGQLGLRQSEALFHHTQALPEMLRELAAQVDLTAIGAVGVSEKPRPVEGSYMPCFTAGISAAWAFAAGRGIPGSLYHPSAGAYCRRYFLRRSARSCGSSRCWYSISLAVPPICFSAGRTAAWKLWVPAPTCMQARLWTASASGWVLHSGGGAGLPPCCRMRRRNSSPRHGARAGMQPVRAGKPVRPSAGAGQIPAYVLPVLPALR